MIQLELMVLELDAPARTSRAANYPQDSGARARLLNCVPDYSGVTLFLPRTAGPVGLKGSAKAESPTAPLVMEMARAVIGQKGDDTSIITPNLDSVSVRLSVIS